MDQFWFLVLVAVATYCAVQIIRDLRRRNYIMAGIGAVCLVALLDFPLQTHAVLYKPF
jgi:hypothetical protein